jgi:tetratricopeptide (TPR) repeat protein
MKPRVGVFQFRAICTEGNEHPLACGITYEIARRLTSIGGVDANAILLGNAGPGNSTASGLADGSSESSFSVEKATGLSVPTLGARYESDYIVLGHAQIDDDLALFFRVYEVETGRLIRDGSVSGLRPTVFLLLDELAQQTRRAIGYLPEENEDSDDSPVHEFLEFEAFTEYCLGRESERPKNALDHLERALEMESGFRQALVEYLSFCYQADDLGNALRHIDAYLAGHPDDQEILIAAANLCLAFHRIDEGIVFAERAHACRPGDVEPRVLLARFLFARELPEVAREHLDAALVSEDGSPDGQYCLGRYFLDLGDYYQARDFFERCLAVDAGYLVALRDLQCCYYELGDFTKGIEACELLLDSDPSDAGSNYNLGLIYHRLGRVHLAVKYFEEAIRQDPSFYKAFFMIGEYELGRGNWAEALGRFEAAHRIHPESAEALGRIGDCHYHLGRAREAYRYYTRARRQDSMFENPRCLLIESIAFVEEGDLAAARLRLLTVTELDERMPEGWNELAWVLLRLDRPEEAFDAIRRAVDLHPDHPALLANLVTCGRRLPLGLRASRGVRYLLRDARRRLRSLESRGIVPLETAMRRHRRVFRSLTWYGVRG